jgi:hypothetical protein
MGYDDGWTAAERAELRKYGAEFEGMSKADVATLVRRYGKSDPALRALASGRPTATSAQVEREREEEAAAQKLYPNTKWGTK